MSLIDTDLIESYTYLLTFYLPSSNSRFSSKFPEGGSGVIEVEILPYLMQESIMLSSLVQISLLVGSCCLGSYGKTFILLRVVFLLHILGSLIASYFLWPTYRLYLVYPTISLINQKFLISPTLLLTMILMANSDITFNALLIQHYLSLATQSKPPCWLSLILMRRYMTCRQLWARLQGSQLCSLAVTVQSCPRKWVWLPDCLQVASKISKRREQSSSKVVWWKRTHLTRFLYFLNRNCPTSLPSHLQAYCLMLFSLEVSEFSLPTRPYSTITSCTSSLPMYSSSNSPRKPSISYSPSSSSTVWKLSSMLSWMTLRLSVKWSIIVQMQTIIGMKAGQHLELVVNMINIIRVVRSPQL